MYRPPTDQQQQYVPTTQPFVPAAVPVYQTAQSLLTCTSSWQPPQAQNQAAQTFSPQLESKLYSFQFFIMQQPIPGQGQDHQVSRCRQQELRHHLHMVQRLLGLGQIFLETHKLTVCQHRQIRRMLILLRNRRNLLRRNL